MLTESYRFCPIPSNKIKSCLTYILIPTTIWYSFIAHINLYQPTSFTFINLYQPTSFTFIFLYYPSSFPFINLYQPTSFSLKIYMSNIFPFIPANILHIYIFILPNFLHIPIYLSHRETLVIEDSRHDAKVTLFTIVICPFSIMNGVLNDKR